jgi:hypothetical protein
MPRHVERAAQAPADDVVEIDAMRDAPCELRAQILHEVYDRAADLAVRILKGALEWEIAGACHRLANFAVMHHAGLASEKFCASVNYLTLGRRKNMRRHFLQ